MTQEEKAKAYEDERIRKEIIYFLSRNTFQFGEDIDKYKSWITWLEKQGKQNPANMVEPKFKVGDWIIFNEHHNSVYQVERIDNYRYYLRHYLGGTLSLHFDNELIRQWTIQDAKDGDVLYATGGYFKEYIFMFSSFTEDSVISTHFGYDIFHETFYKKLTRFGREEEFMSVTPATKEQRELLFQKMKEAGYEWDAEKKEVKKIEQKPKWTDDDKQYLLVCKNALRKYQVSDKWDADIISKWLEDKLKQGELKPKWSEEDEKCIDNCCLLIGAADDCYEKTFKDDCIHYLQSLKERIAWKPMPIKQKDIDDLVFDFKWSNENFKNKKVTDIYRQGIYDVMELFKQRML